MSSPEAAGAGVSPEEIESALRCMKALIAQSIASAEAGGTEQICPPELVQRFLELGTRLHSAEMQAGRHLPAFAQDHGVAATDVMIATTSMLKAVNIQLFELGMWQMWATVK
jgi:hypothetical protein